MLCCAVLGVNRHVLPPVGRFARACGVGFFRLRDLYSARDVNGEMGGSALNERRRDKRANEREVLDAL